MLWGLMSLKNLLAVLPEGLQEVDKGAAEAGDEEGLVALREVGRGVDEGGEHKTFSNQLKRVDCEREIERILFFILVTLLVCLLMRLLGFFVRHCWRVRKDRGSGLATRMKKKATRILCYNPDNKVMQACWIYL